ncbi:FAD-dependent oxidoreductase [Streptomyces sp. SID3343]|uniref:FAD-dependent oxidoreductase n=1 Tax=Streptomyces sp. SID3343 TaxID=2690260 RepID=UPI00136EE448|nr:FAD-dependent oxidoreductase [Streptomyces sp. SID3343]
MTSSRRVGVVGAGMAAARFAQQVAVRDPGASVTVFGDEEYQPYNRALLADVLGARFRPEEIALSVGPSALVRTRTRVAALDAEQCSLRLVDGAVHDFDEIVLATGAGPVLPPIRNVRAGAVPLGLPASAARSAASELLSGVHAFRSLADCAALAAAVPAARRAVVIGGGVLGVSAARALASLGVAVEIVHQAPELMERHLDAPAAGALRRGLEALGVAVYLGNRVRALTGTEHVDGVELANGHVLDADLVVLACGVRPRVALARAAGLRVGAGVVVDDRLATSAPGVYAIGDCAEFAGQVHGLAAAAWDQADVLAAHLTGGGARYAGSRTVLRLTAGPLAVAAFGTTAARSGDDVVRVADPTRNAYKKLVIRGDRLVAAILVGDVATAGALTRAFERDDPLPTDPVHLLATPAAHR